MASLVAVCAALATAASGSIAAGSAVVVVWVVWLVHFSGCARAARPAGADLARAVPVALIMVPLVAMAVHTALAGSAAEWSRNRVIANAAEIISDIERFRERTGSYPVAISSVNPRGKKDISSHACDLLRLPPEEIRRRRGYFASYDLPQAGWKRFLFD